MIQFRTLFLSVFGLFMMACAREEIIVSETSVQDTPIGMQAQKGRLRLKFKSRFAGKAEQAVYTRAGYFPLPGNLKKGPGKRVCIFGMRSSSTNRHL